MKQNITLALDKELLKKVKVLAVKKDTSVTKLLTKHLGSIVSEEDHYESSKKRALGVCRNIDENESLVAGLL